MKSNKGIYILLGVVVLLTGLYFLLTNSKNYKWYETYDGEDKNPFGSYVLVELLKLNKQSDFIYIKKPLNEALQLKDKDANYIFVGDYLPADSSVNQLLLEFVKKGNNAFIATNTPPFQLYKKLPANECFDFEEDYGDFREEGYLEDSVVHFNLSHPKLKGKKNTAFKHQIRNHARKYQWKYLDSVFFCTLEPKIVLLGTLNDSLINFYRINHGKGAFYFHTNPIAFSNFHILRKEGKEYSEKVFSHLSSGDIYWDEYSKMLTYNARTERSESPMKFILSEPGLRAAWYTTLALILIYVLFYAKRKQRIIPLMEANSNSSLEFTQTIGRLYFQQHNHKKISIHKMKFFLGFVRERYGLSTNVLDTSFFNKLSLKSAVPLNNIQIIFNQYHRIKSLPDITEDTLINFHQALEFFYQNCK